MLTLNRTYDVFLIRPGTKLSVITQQIIDPQPTLRVTHDTQVFISKTISVTTQKTCQYITISEEMDCIINKIEENLLSRGIPCLPFLYHNVFPRLLKNLSYCSDDFSSTSDIHMVRNTDGSI